MRSSLFKILASALVIAAPAQRAIAADVPALAARLASLRAEVEELSSELESRKDAQKAALRSLAEQRAELEVQLRREGLRAEQVLAASKRTRTQDESQQELDLALAPVVLEALARARETTARGLPFRLDERQAEIDKLETQVKTKLIRPADAAHRLWQLTEDELRLTRESGLYRQTIMIDGREVLADVARIGMVALYFRTQGGDYGFARRDGEAASYETARDKETTRKLATLFDAFKKQVQVGLFELPGEAFGMGEK